MHQAHLKRCNQQLKVPVNFIVLVYFRVMNIRTERQTDRQTTRTSCLCGLAQARPN